MSLRIALVYPHQLFADHPAIPLVDEVWLIEDPLYFSQYRFHRKKLILHRASMLWYRDQIADRGLPVRIIESLHLSRSADIGKLLAGAGAGEIFFVDPCDDWLSVALTATCQEHSLTPIELPDPHFLTPLAAIGSWGSLVKSRWFFASFYREQRIALNILLEPRNKPVGGSWSFDTENRKRLPRSVALPPIWQPPESSWVIDARHSVARDFPDAIGSDLNFCYPITPADASRQLHDFLAHRLPLFGDYEDAISTRGDILFHSILTPALNIGLLSPLQVVTAALAHQGTVPLNALEGFIRQVIGWREYVRLVYRRFGRMQRTRNALNARSKLPRAFYDGTTGILPVDHVIKNALSTGYAHHIERLMVLGNIMCLCRIDPDAIYQWFMELFIDAYDWVMVPNVYGMSQYADGGLMTTKPYVSGSSYLRKMSDFPVGAWCDIWDALYWTFVADHRPLFEANPRSRMVAGHLDKMGDTFTAHRRRAETFLADL